jgi:acetyl esterase/lipase
MKQLIGLLLFSIPFTVTAQTTISLYPKEIPNNKKHQVKEIETINNQGWVSYEKVSVPNLVLHKPTQPNGTVMIIAPGGGYKHLAYTKEGTLVAKALNEYGITCLVLKYRHPLDSTMFNKNIGPIQDLQQAILYVRTHAKELGINPAKVGVMGFSAGGHLASTAVTHFETNYLPEQTTVSLRPDFGALIYPVINLSNEYQHAGSRTFLLGETPSDSLIKAFSNDLRITPNTPPTFLMHAIDDKTVKVENSIRFQRALREQKIPNDIFIYKTGGHGFALNNTTDNTPWLPKLIEFMKQQGFLQ